MNKLNILLPLYNDWKSLNSLLRKINIELKKRNRYVKILVLNDSSTQKINIIHKKLKFIKNIKVLTTNKNLGSQKIISIGLNYIKKIKNELIVVMDSDGEDDVSYLNTLIDESTKRKGYVIVAKRTKRKENFLFKVLYKFHIIITFFLTMKWISFGNYSCFHSKQLKEILKNNLSWLAYSSCIIRNCNIFKVDSERQKRFFGKSKLSFFGLFKHSFRILSVFQIKILLTSTLYILIALFLGKINSLFEIENFFALALLILNFLIFITKKNTLKDYPQKKFYIKTIDVIK